MQSQFCVAYATFQREWEENTRVDEYTGTDGGIKNELHKQWLDNEMETFW